MKSEERTIDEKGNFLKEKEFEKIWIAENVNHQCGISSQLSDDDCIDYYIWQEINGSTMYKKHLPTTKVISGENPNIIFHGGCLGCLSQRKHGISRCKGCRYFPTKKWSYPNLFIEG